MRDADIFILALRTRPLGGIVQVTQVTFNSVFQLVGFFLRCLQPKKSHRIRLLMSTPSKGVWCVLVLFFLFF